DLPIGKRTSIINDEPGSKLILITNAAAPAVQVDIHKGKSRTPETVEQNLVDIIDVKGMKAQGNRLSSHEVTKVTLLTAEEQVMESAMPKEQTPTVESADEPDAVLETPAAAPVETPQVAETTPPAADAKVPMTEKKLETKP